MPCCKGAGRPPLSISTPRLMCVPVANGGPRCGGSEVATIGVRGLLSSMFDRVCV